MALKHIDELTNEQLAAVSKDLLELVREHAANKPYLTQVLMDTGDLILQEMLCRAVGDRDVATRLHRERQGN